MSRIQKQIGDRGEQLAHSTLAGLGIECLEKIGTPVHLTPVAYGQGHYATRMKGRQAYYVTFGDKVSGDMKGVLPTGRGVLVEVKTRWDNNLEYGFLETHQHAGLARFASFGGLSLLVYVHNSGVYVMSYPVAGFRKGTSITPTVAKIQDEITRALIAQEIKSGNSLL